MKKIVFSISALVGGFFAQAQLQNPGFEQTDNNFPVEWSNKMNDLYEMNADNGVKHSGSYSLKISDKQGNAKGLQTFSQKVPVPGKGLRKVEISAYIKSEDTRGNIALWTQVRDKAQNMVDFANSDTQKRKVIPNGDWKKYSLEFMLDDQADYFVLGGFLSGNGKVWFDDFSISEIPFPENPASKTAFKYIDQFKNIVKKNSIFKDKIDWNILESNLKKISNGMETVKDTGPAIQYVMKTLSNAGDNHSFIDNKEYAEEKKSMKNPLYEPSSKLLDQNIGYIMVPAFSSLNKEVGSSFAEKIQKMIQKLDSENTIKGWIVDLRTNTGGNMYPMITGLGPLTGEGILGYFTKDGKNKTAWKYKNGKMYNIEVSNPYTLKIPDQKIAVLIGPSTASSGEATTLSFVGKTNIKTFGQPSAGLTSANQAYQLSDGRSLYLAISYEMDRTGKEYKGKIQPDYIIEPSENTNFDAEIQAATQWILK
ncbi:S41 family peptidase [Chryseobacterium populi]|uniref:Periplasmic protease n=1 Tax=Chryseobacterium populi TaxID=1144316 RepID=J2SRV3_9FLAO|nr:S41 family peptidase [Chryseobacterium populi]EJL68297.1 periplasmic protease [Chryseobacterium populi]